MRCCSTPTPSSTCSTTIVAGDGRANENFALTSMHTIWARNHNFHVDNLVAAASRARPEELFQAAKMLNEAEYQRVVFTEFADKLLGGASAATATTASTATTRTPTPASRTSSPLRSTGSATR